MTLFFAPEGPMLRYADGLFEISDLNPERNFSWRLSRFELARIGWRCFVAALRK